MKKDFGKFANSHMGVSSTSLHDYQKTIAGNAAGPTSLFDVHSSTPHIVEEREMNAVAMSVFDRLMMDRIIFLGTPIDDTVANIINAQLLWLESVDNEKPINMYINSPGGSVYAGLGIYDVMNYINVDINTINTGLAASMAAILLCAGKDGNRMGLRHSRTMIHQPLGDARGQASDIEIAAEEIKKLKKELYEIIAEKTKKSLKVIEKDGDRDFWMTAEEAKQYGLINRVL